MWVSNLHNTFTYFGPFLKIWAKWSPQVKINNHNGSDLYLAYKLVSPYSKVLPILYKFQRDKLWLDNEYNNPAQDPKFNQNQNSIKPGDRWQTSTSKIMSKKGVLGKIAFIYFQSLALWLMPFHPAWLLITDMFDSKNVALIHVNKSYTTLRVGSNVKIMERAVIFVSFTLMKLRQLIWRDIFYQFILL